MADEIKASPRNPYLAYIADALNSGADTLKDYRVHEAVPFLGGTTIDDLIGLRGASRTMNEASYGSLPMRVPEMSYIPQMQQGRGKDVADTLMFGDMAGATGIAALRSGMGGVRAGAKALMDQDFNAGRRQVAGGAAVAAGLAATPALLRKAVAPIERGGAEDVAALGTRVAGRAAVHADYPAYLQAANAWKKELYSAAPSKEEWIRGPLGYYRPKGEHRISALLGDVEGRMVDFGATGNSRENIIKAWKNKHPEQTNKFHEANAKNWDAYDAGAYHPGKGIRDDGSDALMKAVQKEDNLLTLHLDSTIPGDPAKWARMRELQGKSVAWHPVKTLNATEYTELKTLTKEYHDAAEKLGHTSVPKYNTELKYLPKEYSRGGRVRLI